MLQVEVNSAHNENLVAVGQISRLLADYVVEESFNCQGTYSAVIWEDELAA